MTVSPASSHSQRKHNTSRMAGELVVVVRPWYTASLQSPSFTSSRCSSFPSNLAAEWSSMISKFGRSTSNKQLIYSSPYCADKHLPAGYPEPDPSHGHPSTAGPLPLPFLLRAHWNVQALLHSACRACQFLWCTSTCLYCQYQVAV